MEEAGGEREDERGREIYEGKRERETVEGGGGGAEKKMR